MSSCSLRQFSESGVIMVYSQYLGSDWSWYPANNRRGTLNIVKGTKAVCSRILHVLLTRKGEDPIHPDLGIAPMIFEPLSDVTPQFFVNMAQSTIAAWNNAGKIGISYLAVSADQPQPYQNEIIIRISFIPVQQASSTVDMLTFGFFQYKGAMYSGTFDAFLNSIRLNNISYAELQ